MDREQEAERALLFQESECLPVDPGNELSFIVCVKIQNFTDFRKAIRHITAF